MSMLSLNNPPSCLPSYNLSLNSYTSSLPALTLAIPNPALTLATIVASDFIRQENDQINPSYDKISLSEVGSKSCFASKEDRDRVNLIQVLILLSIPVSSYRTLKLLSSILSARFTSSRFARASPNVPIAQYNPVF